MLLTGQSYEYRSIAIAASLERTDTQPASQSQDRPLAQCPSSRRRVFATHTVGESLSLILTTLDSRVCTAL